MSLSERTVSLLRQYFNYIEPLALAYRENIIRNVTPEQLHISLHRFYTTERPDEPISPIIMSYAKNTRLAWRAQLINAHVPHPYSQPNWYQDTAIEIRTKLDLSFVEDLPISEEEIENFDLKQSLFNFVKEIIDRSAQRYLAIIIGGGEFLREQAIQIIIRQVNIRINPETCSEYAGCYLYNFLLDPPTQSVKISPETEIRMTTFGDIEREVSSLGFYSWDEGNFLPPQYMLVTKLDEKPLYQRILGFGGNWSTSEIDNTIIALRLFQTNYVGIRKIGVWTAGIPISFGHLKNITPDRFIDTISSSPYNDPTYTLKVENIAEITKMLQNIKNTIVQNKLKIALARFNDSYKWSDGRERIIDLVIAIENIFGEETVGQSTEVGYRLRMRAARYLGNSLEERERLMQFFSNLYTLRSKIVHGDSDEIDALVEKKFKKTLSDVIQETEEYLRKSLQKLIDNPSHIGQNYFNKLLLGIADEIVSN